MANTQKTNPEELNVKTVEELEKLLRESQKQNEAMQKQLAEQEKAMKESASRGVLPSPATNDPKELNRRVVVRLPVDGKNDVEFVRFNDATYLIKRGVDVSVPYYVYLHIRECMAADDAVKLRLAGLEARFMREAEKYNV